MMPMDVPALVQEAIERAVTRVHTPHEHASQEAAAYLMRVVAAERLAALLANPDVPDEVKDFARAGMSAEEGATAYVVTAMRVGVAEKVAPILADPETPQSVKDFLIDGMRLR